MGVVLFRYNNFRFLLITCLSLVFINCASAQKRGTISAEGGTMGGKGTIVTYPLPGVSVKPSPDCPPFPSGGSVALQCSSKPGIEYGKPTEWECRWVIVYPNPTNDPLKGKIVPLDPSCVEPQPPLPNVSVNKCAEFLVKKNPTGFCDCIENARDAKTLPGTLLNSCCKAVGGMIDDGFAGRQCIMPVPTDPGATF